jgi:hypothetical protein
MGLEQKIQAKITGSPTEVERISQILHDVLEALESGGRIQAEATLTKTRQSTEKQVLKLQSEIRKLL